MNKDMKTIKYNKRASGKAIIILLAIIAAFIAGYFYAGTKGPSTVSDNSHESTQENEKWFCSMHPQIIKDGPGLCPICEMDLIPMDNSGVEDGPGEISFSKNALKLMELETAVVESKAVDIDLRLVGKVAYDQTNIRHITAWTSGRINRMFVDFTGTRVIKGDHMVELYSPQLNTARQEYLQAYNAVNNFESDSLAAMSARSTLLAAQEKLKLLGVSQSDINSIRSAEDISNLITINSPEDGIVIEKHLNEGAYVKSGDMIYTIADLHELWVMLDAYESDLQWIRYGQKASFSVAAYPGETFDGTVSFISPAVDPKSRTVKVRLNVNNDDGRLKPDMFVKSLIKSTIADSNVVMTGDMAGKWICPMHPSIVKDHSGICDICQMDLVTTESLGYVTSDNIHELPLVIPATAPLITGKRAVVYVEIPDRDRSTYAGREVVLGPRAGDYYIVREGLTAGDRVVINGNFKIDSALQIKAQNSMMNPDNSGVMELQPSGNGQQTMCPVMGGPINKDIFIEYKGKKVYFCCGGCDDMFLKEPEKYIDKLPQFKDADNETEEVSRAGVQTKCPVMGGDINKDIFIEYKGKKVYFCCKGCDDMFLKDPQKYIDKLPQFKTDN